jgi:putative tricarboxylic transport membrane protein
MSDRIFAVLWLGVCGVIFWQMWNLAVPFTYEPVGPKAFPILLAISMSLCCGAILINPDRDTHWPERAALIKGAILVASLLAYGFLFEVLGFPIATAAMVIIVGRLFGGRWIPSGAAGVAIGIFGYFFFDTLLQVSLPIGRIWG